MCLKCVIIHRQMYSLPSPHYTKKGRRKCRHSFQTRKNSSLSVFTSAEHSHKIAYTFILKTMYFYFEDCSSCSFIVPLTKCYISHLICIDSRTIHVYEYLPSQVHLIVIQAVNYFGCGSHMWTKDWGCWDLYTGNRKPGKKKFALLKLSNKHTLKHIQNRKRLFNLTGALSWTPEGKL